MPTTAGFTSGDHSLAAGASFIGNICFPQTAWTSDCLEQLRPAVSAAVVRVTCAAESQQQKRLPKLLVDLMALEAMHPAAEALPAASQ